MPTLKVGNTEVTDVRVGNTEVQDVYVGGTEVWTNGCVITNGLAQFNGTVGSSPNDYDYTIYYRGFDEANYGSINDQLDINGTLYTVRRCYWFEFIYEPQPYFSPWRLFSLEVYGTLPRTAFSTLTVGNQSFSPTDNIFHAHHQSTTPSGTVSYWTWRRAESNGEDLSDLPSPFNSTAGTKYRVTVS